MRKQIIYLLYFLVLILAGCSGPSGAGSAKSTVQGEIAAPASVDVTSLTVVSLGEDYPVAPDGAFSAEVYSDGVSVIAAMQEGKAFGLMNVVSTAAGGVAGAVKSTSKALSPNGIVLDAKTTAVSLVFLTPYLATNDPDRAGKILKIIEEDSKVAILASVIESIFNEADPVESPALQAALGEALKSVLTTIAASAPSAPVAAGVAGVSSATKVVMLPKTSGSPVYKALPSEYSIDTDYIKLGITESAAGYLVNVDSRQANAVDWIAEIAKLNPSQFTSTSDLQGASADKLHVYVRDSVLGRDRVSAKGFLKYIDFLGAAIDAAFSYFTPESVVAVPSATDGVYIVRTFSGGGWGADPAERANLASVPNGYSNDSKALALNFISGSLDLMSLVIDLKGLETNCLSTVISSTIDSFSAKALTVSSPDDLVKIVPDISAELQNGVAVLGCATKAGAQNLLTFIAKTTIHASVEALKWISQYKWVEIASTAGSLIERGIKLYEYATPVESTFIVVGSPFPALYHTQDSDCSSCHQSIRPATHTSNTLKYPVDCAVCHTYPAWLPSKFLHETGLDCSSCHQSIRPATHTSNALKYPVDCSRCHTYPAWSASIHKLGTNCSSCHSMQRPYSHTSNPQAYPADCEMCHAYPSWVM